MNEIKNNEFENDLHSALCNMLSMYYLRQTKYDKVFRYTANIIRTENLLQILKIPYKITYDSEWNCIKIKVGDHGRNIYLTMDTKFVCNSENIRDLLN